MKKIFLLILLLAMVLTLNSAMAADSSPYLSGIWYLDDCQNCISETEIANPTSLTLQVEAVFYDSNGNFCGCDYHVMNPNSLWKFESSDYEGGTISGNYGATLFSNCGDGRGHLKVIAHTPCNRGPWNCAITAFTYMTDLSGPTLTGFNRMYRHGFAVNAGMAGVTLNIATKTDMYNIYNACRNSKD